MHQDRHNRTPFAYYYYLQVSKVSLSWNKKKVCSYFACGSFLQEEEEVEEKVGVVVVVEEGLRDDGTTGLCNEVNLVVGTLGVLILLSVDSMEDTEGGLLSKDLSPQSIFEDTLDRFSLGEAL